MPSDTKAGPEIFKCQKCGDCCKGYGGTFLTRKDIKTIAEHIGKNPNAFITKYCQRSGDKTILAQGLNGYCIFWDKFCTIHPVKPRMCREWPFIKSVLVDAKNWHIIAGSCRGMRTGVTDDTIMACVKRERDRLDPE